MIWTEKYRPKKFGDVIGVPKQIKAFIKNPTHLLMVGDAGIGKTTVARILAKELDAELMELNASDDRGIQVIRDKVKFFAKKASVKMKIALLDEADGITRDAQQSLRRIMEIYAMSTLFILTANYLRRIIDPIRSRCTIVEFPAPDDELIIKRLKYICDNEKIKCDDDSLAEIVARAYPDIRKSINMLQSYCLDGKLNTDGIEDFKDLADAVFELILEGDYNTIRAVLTECVPNYDEMFRYLYNKIYESGTNDKDKKKAMIEIADRMWKNQSVADPEINFMACIFRIEDVLQEV